MAAFIESGEPLSGSLKLTELPRLAEELAADADASQLAPIQWQALGRLVKQRVGEPQLWLDLQAQGEIALECQRCLQAVTQTLSFSRSIRFAKDEAAAAELDADSEDDVLAVSRQFDLLELVEDELIMALPIVPRHEVCPTDVASLMQADVETPPPGQPAGEVGAETEEPGASGKPNPFAVLAALKKNPS